MIYFTYMNKALKIKMISFTAFDSEDNINGNQEMQS